MSVMLCTGPIEAVTGSCSVKKVFLEIWQNSQENTCARVSFLIKLPVFSCEFCEISKNTFPYRTPPVAASGVTFVKINSCLVARIISFDTACLHLLTFYILEPYPSKDIELELSHVISHQWR